MGGVAIFAAVTLVLCALVPGSRQTYVLLASSAWLFLVGLVDDVICLKPYQKLIGQIMGATAVVSCGMTLSWTGSLPLNITITIFWLVGITNAVNLLDNMDGLAGGIAAIASAFLSLHFLGNGQSTDTLTMAVFAASLVGFLVYNSHPASIFMGDCGSMFVGFFLAGATLLHPASGRSRSVLPVLAVPVLVLLIPIFDTVFVIVLRTLAGRSVSRGGRDHTSHRLVALGLSERRAVWMLYTLAVMSGLLALLVRDIELDVSLAVIIAFTLLLSLVGVHLAGVKVYEESEVRNARDQPLVAFLIDLSYKRRVFEVLLDVVLIVLSYYAAYSLAFGPITDEDTRRRFVLGVPVLVLIKLSSFLVMGVYRGIWRYTGLHDLVVVAKAVLLGSVASVLVLLFVFRFHGFSRVVFVLDGLILLMLHVGSRMSFRLFRKLLSAPAAQGGRRVLIYGAGDAGELLLRELLNNPALRFVPIGFADDDPLKKGKVIHGLRVFGGNGSLRRICEEQRIDEVLISSPRITEERVRDIVRDCVEASVAVKRLRIQIELLNAPTSFKAGSAVHSGS